MCACSELGTSRCQIREGWAASKTRGGAKKEREEAGSEDESSEEEQDDAMMEQSVSSLQEDEDEEDARRRAQAHSKKTGWRERERESLGGGDAGGFGDKRFGLAKLRTLEKRLSGSGSTGSSRRERAVPSRGAGSKGEEDDDDEGGRTEEIDPMGAYVCVCVRVCVRVCVWVCFRLVAGWCGGNG
eukprot:1580492-Rhodomonas_salina.2